MTTIISIKALSKSYKSGLKALDSIDLDIYRAEIFALLGPNGAGKTTLISTVCGIVTKTSGTILIDGHDNVTDYRAARQMIGLVPQELNLPIFETVIDTVRFSRALFGFDADEAKIEAILKQLTLWDKRDAKIVTLSGGMKRRVLIAKALAHEPKILFLDEPTAGVDVELRKDMWNVVRDLRAQGVTIILTTHYIEEAEEMADRIGVINQGKMILVEDKDTLIKKLGRKKLTLDLAVALQAIPATLHKYGLELSADRKVLSYAYDTKGEGGGVAALLSDLTRANISYNDLHTEQSSLEDIFMGLVKQ
jgi:ABC-2 type transport system ATP-binding protein